MKKCKKWDKTTTTTTTTTLVKCRSARICPERLKKQLMSKNAIYSAVPIRIQSGIFWCIKIRQNFVKTSWWKKNSSNYLMILCKTELVITEKVLTSKWRFYNRILILTIFFVKTKDFITVLYYEVLKMWYETTYAIFRLNNRMTRITVYVKSVLVRKKQRI